MSVVPELWSPGVVSLGFDLLALKLYEVAVVALWVYDYFLTLPREINYCWNGKKTPVFWLFILNRYLCPMFMTITVFTYFSPAFTTDVSTLLSSLMPAYPQILTNPLADVCQIVYGSEILRSTECSYSCHRYGVMETLETALMTCIAEVFLTLRVYALSKRNRIVLLVAVSIILTQWALVFYGLTFANKGTANVAFLINPPEFPPPPVPDTDPYHVCIYISILKAVPYATGWLSLALAFDTLAFLAIIFITLRQTKEFGVIPMISVIQRDGVIYFFVLFSSNLIWLLLLLYARPALKFMHNQPAMIFSAIMINRITLNLKGANEQQREKAWGIQTFEQPPALPRISASSSRPSKFTSFSTNTYSTNTYTTITNPGTTSSAGFIELQDVTAYRTGV